MGGKLGGTGSGRNLVDFIPIVRVIVQGATIIGVCHRIPLDGLAINHDGVHTHRKGELKDTVGTVIQVVTLFVSSRSIIQRTTTHQKSQVKLFDIGLIGRTGSQDIRCFTLVGKACFVAENLSLLDAPEILVQLCHIRRLLGLRSRSNIQHKAGRNFLRLRIVKRAGVVLDNLLALATQGHKRQGGSGD